MQIRKAEVKKVNEYNSSGLSYDEISTHYCEWFDHCSEVLSSENVQESFKLFIKNILDYLEDWEHITWKQFKSVLKISVSSAEYLKNKHGDLSTFRFGEEVLYFDKQSSVLTSRGFSGTTEQELDNLHRIMFGEPRFYECEEEGKKLAYVKGKRVFLLPTES